MTNALSRIQVVDAPPAAPGHCALCGTTQGPMVDFGMNMEFYGVIYFCIENCLVELANSFDYHSPRQWKMLMNQIDDQREELNKLRDQNEQLLNTIDHINSYRGISPVDRVPELDMEQVLTEPSPEPEQLAFDFSEEGDGSSEQVDEQRPADLLSDDRDDLSIDDFLADI